jgi:hypothetical protein
MEILAAVGIAKCPVTGKIYGVRVEERTGKKWFATWAFPIKPETAKKEGYTEQQFPPDLLYDKEYPGCPYCKKHEDLAEITKAAAQKDKKKEMPKICVTNPGFDNIGAILHSMKIKFEPFNSKQFDCDVLFLNCGTSDHVDGKKLESFVDKGGCLYASDRVEHIVKQAFPSLINFAGRVGSAMSMPVDVVDGELREIAGDKLNITFDMGAWVVINDTKGDVLLRSSSSNESKYANKPVMVKMKYGKGIIFYTSFHNHAQASEKEKALLQLLLLKQFGSSSNSSIKDASSNLNVDLDEIKAKFKFNF